jgi:hypothetical protein
MIMAEGLPEFQKYPRDVTIAFAKQIFSTIGAPHSSHFVRLEEYEDGHYRAIFRPSYFILPEGQQQPSKSQWNSLKKRIKRHNPRVFIFKEHGETPCGAGDDGRCYYVDFGFFAR